MVDPAAINGGVVVVVCALLSLLVPTSYLEPGVVQITRTSSSSNNNNGVPPGVTIHPKDVGDILEEIIKTQEEHMYNQQQQNSKSKIIDKNNQQSNKNKNIDKSSSSSYSDGYRFLDYLFPKSLHTNECNNDPNDPNCKQSSTTTTTTTTTIHEGSPGDIEGDTTLDGGAISRYVVLNSTTFSRDYIVVDFTNIVTGIMIWLIIITLLIIIIIYLLKMEINKSDQYESIKIRMNMLKELLDKMKNELDVKDKQLRDYQSGGNIVNGGNDNLRKITTSTTTSSSSKTSKIKESAKDDINGWINDDNDIDEKPLYNPNKPSSRDHHHHHQQHLYDENDDREFIEKKSRLEREIAILKMKNPNDPIIGRLQSQLDQLERDNRRLKEEMNRRDTLSELERAKMELEAKNLIEKQKHDQDIKYNDLLERLKHLESSLQNEKSERQKLELERLKSDLVSKKVLYESGYISPPNSNSVPMTTTRTPSRISERVIPQNDSYDRTPTIVSKTPVSSSSQKGTTLHRPQIMPLSPGSLSPTNGTRSPEICKTCAMLGREHKPGVCEYARTPNFKNKERNYIK